MESSHSRARMSRASSIAGIADDTSRPVCLRNHRRFSPCQDTPDSMYTLNSDIEEHRVPELSMVPCLWLLTRVELCPPAP